MEMSQSYLHALLPPIVVAGWQELHRDLPSPILVVSDDAVYVAAIRYASGQGVRPFVFVRFAGGDIIDGVPIATFLDNIFAGSGDQLVDEVSLVPDSDRRIAEARSLGQIVDERSGFYIVQRPNQRVLVCDKKDATSYAVGENADVSITFLR